MTNTRNSYLSRIATLLTMAIFAFVGAPPAQAMVVVDTAIGDRVWIDADHDGVQQDSEAGLAGVTVQLLNANRTVIQQTATAAGGVYRFSHLVPGQYYIAYVLPSGYVFSPRNTTVSSSVDSDPAVNSGMTSCITLAAGQVDLTWDAGVYQPHPAVQIIKTAGTGKILCTDLAVETAALSLAASDDAVGLNQAAADDAAGLTLVAATASKSLAASDDAAGLTIVAASDEKLNNAQFAPDGKILYVNSGDTVTYRYLVRNNGDVPLAKLVVTDDKLGDIGVVPGPLLPGQQFLFTRSVANVTADVTNIAVVEGQPCYPDGNPLALSRIAAKDDAKVSVYASLGDRVWLDSDRDGIQDEGEPGLAGVAVRLLDSTRTQVQQTSTDAKGFYRFTQLLPGSYSVAFGLVAGHVFTTRDAGKDDTDSDADVVSGMTASITLDGGQNYLACDAGLFRPSPAVQLIKTAGTVADGQILYVNSGDSVTYQYLVKNTGDVALKQLAVSDDKLGSIGTIPGPLLRGQTATLTKNATNITAAVTNVGTVSGQPCYPDGTPMPLPTVSATDDARVSLFAALGDRVWVDADRNGIQNQGEAGIEGVTVSLLDAAGTTLKTTATAADGTYRFSLLIPGTYYVEFALPSGHLFSPRGAGGNDALDSDVNPATGRTALITLAAGEIRLSVDAGMVPCIADLELTQTALPATEYPSTWSIPVSKGEQSVSGDYWLRLEYGQPSFDVWGPGNLKSGVTVDARWHHVVGRFTRGTESWGPHTLEIFVDGTLVAVRNATGTTDTSTAPLFLGAYLGNSYFYAGLMDEVRLSRTARSNAWLATTHNQQSAPASFITWGTQQSSSQPGYVYQKTLTVNAAQVAGDLKDFPVLVSRTDADFANGIASADGFDVVFTLPDGTPLAHEIESFNAAAGRLVAWVKLPTLSATGDTEFRMHYGNPDGTGPTARPADVWDSAFTMVQHLSTAVNGKVLDSTANHNDGTVAGAVPAAFGSASGAFAFDGTNDLIRIADSPTLKFDTDFTMEGWFSRRSLPADGAFEIAVVNKGPDMATAVQVTDYLPTGMTLADYVPSQGSFDPVSGVWPLGSLDVGARATLTLLVNSTDANAVNTAEITSTESIDPDSTPGNHRADEDDQASATLKPVAALPLSGEKPDFIISAIAFQSAPAAGATVTAKVTVLNQGKAAGNAGALKLWANHPLAATTAETADTVQTIGTLGIGQSTTVTFSFVAPATAATHTFRAFVDGQNVTTEQSEGNNQLTKSYTFNTPVVERPDFIITSVTFITPPVRGMPCTARVNVKNQGKAPGNPGVLNVWADHYTAATVAETADIAVSAPGVLAIGESIQRIVTFTAPATMGTHTFRAFIDGANATVEQSEGNNQKTVTYGWY